MKQLQLHSSQTHTGKTRILVEAAHVYGEVCRRWHVYILQRNGGGTRKRKRIKGGPKLISLNTAEGPLSFEARRRTGVTVLYVLKRGVTLTGRLHFSDTAKRIVPERFPANFAAAWDHALRTAR
jgi:hypothetical protein